MSYNNNNTKKDDPLVVLIGATAFIIFVILFCVIVWSVTHRNDNDIVINNSSVIIQTPESSEKPSTSQSRTEETSESEEESSEETLPEYEDTSNDLGMTFKEVLDKVTAVDVTNLRSEPSTAQGKNTVVAQLKNGQKLFRIGVHEETGWSKLIYDGRVVYASTNYLLKVSEED